MARKVTYVEDPLPLLGEMFDPDSGPSLNKTADANTPVVKVVHTVKVLSSHAYFIVQ
jgi:hypothetical protein